jgi:hypothetical protein
MSFNKKFDGVKIAGYRGRWSQIADSYYNGKKCYLLEHDTYGDETCGLLVDEDLNVIDETYDCIATTVRELTDGIR